MYRKYGSNRDSESYLPVEGELWCKPLLQYFYSSFTVDPVNLSEHRGTQKGLDKGFLTPDNPDEHRI